MKLSTLTVRSNVKRICFTIHDYCLDDVRNIFKLDFDYVVIGYERCPNTGRRHIQGFVNLTRKCKFNTFKEKIGKKAHLEQARGTDSENRTYCTKDGWFIEEGTPKTQGERSDLQRVCETIVSERLSISDVARRFSGHFVRYHRGLREFQRIVNPIIPRKHKTTVRVFVGAPGSGKSLRAANEGLRLASDDKPGGVEGTIEREQNPDGLQELDGIYYKPRGEWWDGYVQQPVVIFDDFYGWIKYDELLKICDRYPLKVPIKGGFEEFTSKHIFITSNVAIDKWYKFEGYNPEAIYRRLTEYKLFERQSGIVTVYSERNYDDSININY